MKKTFVILVSIFIFNLNAIKHHTIYISGPPVSANSNWFKESRYIYSGLKKEIIDQGNSIELFPKKRYRDSIVINKHIRSRSMSKKRLLRRYLDLTGLMQELMELIILRRDEIIAINLESEEDGWDTQVWDTRIHLRSHSNGDILISMLIYGGYGELLGSLISIDGNECVSDTRVSVRQVSNLSEIITSDPAYSQEVCNGNTIINVTINDLEDLTDTSGCLKNKEATLGMIGTMLGVVGAILALL